MYVATKNQGKVSNEGPPMLKERSLCHRINKCSKDLTKAMIWVENWSMLKNKIFYILLTPNMGKDNSPLTPPLELLPGTVWMIRSNSKQCRQPHKGCLLRKNPQNNLFKTILNTLWMLFQYHFCIWCPAQSSESRCPHFQWCIRCGSIHPGCTSEY